MSKRTKIFLFDNSSLKNAQITALFHGIILVMAIHVFHLNYSISLEVPQNSGRCHGFTGFFLHLCSE